MAAVARSDRPSPSLAGLAGVMRGKVALVTGAAAGIGLAVSALLGELGAVVHLLDLPSSSLAERAAELRALGVAAFPQPGSVTDLERIAAVVGDVVGRHGRIDILVASAGISGPVTSSELTTPELWQDVLAVDLVGTHQLASSVARVMAMQGQGQIVVISSVAAYMPRVGRVAYGAAKAGLSAMVRTMALELAPSGVTVNAVCPGPVDTEFFRRSLASPTDLAERLAAIPAGRLTTTADVANAVVFLASPCAISITGQNLHVNGGEFMI
jgi:NAD(P)-dependent dehydrogenase (short-subunit alcohol dehydrogenase family)